MCSYSPLYKQNVIWVAEYDDGNLLREWDDDGKSHPFNEIDKSKLRKFHLVSAEFDYFFDCKTGIFVVDGREFVFPLTGLDLNYANGLIHFKSACTEFIPVHLKSHEYDGFEILNYEMGWKVTYGGMKSQVIFSLPEKVFNAEVTFLEIPKTINWQLKLDKEVIK